MIADPEFGSFSHAATDPAGRRSLRARLIVDAVKIHTASFLRRRGEEVHRASSGLEEVLSDWCRCQPTIDEAMRLPLALGTLRDVENDPVWVAALSAAHLHSAGRDGEWRACFAQPASVGFGWRTTPPAQEIGVSACAGRVELRLNGGEAVELGTLPASVPAVDLGGSSVPILGPDTQCTFPVDDSIGFAGVPAREVAVTLCEAASILRSYAPSYLAWVEDAISAVVPIPSPGDRITQSFSVQGLNGVVFVSFPAPPLKIAEALVHESSHQYYHFGQLDTLFANGMDEALYFSPYVRKDRPIERILLAFHAFANIVLFYRACLSAGMSEGGSLAEEAIAFHVKHLGPMSGYLQHSSGLTPTGRGIFEPLRDELFR